MTILSSSGGAHRKGAWLAATLVAFVLGGAATARGQASSATWTANASGNWTATANWGVPGGAYAAGAGNTATFQQNFSVNPTVTLDAPITIGNILFDDTSDGNYLILNHASNVLTLDAGGGSPTITVNDGWADNAREIRVSVILDGTAGFTRAGAGTVKLEKDNTYTGITYLNGGAVRMPAAGGLGSTADGTVVASGASLWLDGYLSGNVRTYNAEPLTINGTGYAAAGMQGALHRQANNTLTWTGPITLGSAAAIGTPNSGGNLILDVASGNAIDNAGYLLTLNVSRSALDVALDVKDPIVGTGGLTKGGNGNGILWLEGTNTYSGATTVSVGTLRARDAVGLPSASYLTLNTGVWESGADITRTTDTVAGAGKLNILGNSAGFGAYGNDVSITLNGGADLAWGTTAGFSPGSPLVLNNTSADRKLTWQNNIDLGTAARTIAVHATAAGAEVVLNGTLTTASANLSLTKTGSGELQLGASNRIGDNLDLTLNGGTFDLQAFSDTVDAFLVNAAATIDGSGTLTAASHTVNPNANVTVNCSLAGTAASAGLAKSGTGILYLNSANTYQGATTVSGGTLVIAAEDRLGPAPGALVANQLTLSGGATLNTTASLNLGASRGVTIGSATGGTLSVDPSATLTLNAPVAAGAAGLVLTKAGAGALALGAGDLIADSLDLTISAGTLDLGAFNETVDAVLVSGAATLGGSGTLTASSYAVTPNADVTVNCALAGGAAALAKSGTGTLTLNAANSFGGAVTLSAGTMVCGDDSALPATAAVSVEGGTLAVNGHSVTLASLQGVGGMITLGGGALAVGGGADTTWGGEISGAGALTKQGAGTLFLAGAQTYSGATEIAAGTVTLLPAIAAPTAITGCRLWLDGSDPDGDGAVEGAGENYIPGGVTTWADKSGSGRNFTQATVARQPVYNPAYANLNSRGVFDFTGNTAADANGDCLTYTGTGPLAVGDDDYTYVIVWRADLHSQYRYAYSQGDGAGNGERACLILSNASYGFNGLNNDANGFVTSAANQNNVTIMQLDNNNRFGIPGGPNVRVYDEGTLFTATTGAPASLNVQQGLTIVGSSVGTAEFFDGAIAEVIVYDRVLDAAERAQLGYLLEQKYNIATSYSNPTGSLPAETALALTASGATLDLNGVSQTVASLTGVAGSEVKLGGATFTVGDATSTAFTGVVSGASGVLVKTGSGALTLAGTSTFAGAAIVSNGTLAVTGALASTTGVTVRAGATLTGGGSVAGALAVEGALAAGPAAGTGVLTVNGSAAIGAGAITSFQIDGVGAGTEYDRLAVNGTVALAGALALNFDYDAAPGTSFTLISNDGADAVTGTFGGLPDGAAFSVGSETLTIDYNGGDGNDVVVTVVAGAAEITNEAVSGLGQGSAIFNATLTSTGSSATAVWVAWGDEDGYADGKWDHTNFVEQVSAAVPPYKAYAVPVSGLTPGAAYYYSFYASNATVVAKATPASVSFAARGAPQVRTDGATGVAATAATLNGFLEATNQLATTVWVYWGNNEGNQPTPPALGTWDHVESFGVRSVGALSTNLTGLASNTTYYCRFVASNSLGTAWASATGSFKTFLPNQVAGCLLWLRADLGIATNGSDVTQWDDQSGNGHYAEGTTYPGNRPTWNATGLNGLPTVEFAAANNDFLTMDTTTFGFQHTFIVYRDTSTTDWCTPMGCPYSGGAPFHGDDNAGGLYLFNATHTLLATRNGSNLRDGVSIGTGTGTARPSAYVIQDHQATAAFTSTHRLQYLGTDPSGVPNTVRDINGGIAEIIMYNRALTADERARVGYYLQERYGIAGAYTVPPVIESAAATEIVATEARANAYVLELGGLASTVYLYWGEVDRGDNSGALKWANTNQVGSVGGAVVGAVDFLLTSLTSGVNYYYRLAVSNATYGIVFSTSTVTFQTAVAGGLQVRNDAATGFSTSGATANGTLLSSGDDPSAYAYLYWGTQNAGDNSGPVRWAHTNLVAGTFGDGDPIAHPLAGLAPSTLYYYRFRASNSTETAWSANSASSFYTYGPPVVATAAATAVYRPFATVHAGLTFDGGEPATVRFYWGTADAGDNSGPLKWAHTNDVAGTFTTGESPSLTLTNLSFTTEYWFRAAAENAHGESFAFGSLSFTTAGGALTFTSAQSGNWSDAATWTHGVEVPVAGDQANLVSGHDVVYDAAASGAAGGVDLALNAGRTSLTLQRNLALSGTFQMNGNDGQSDLYLNGYNLAANYLNLNDVANQASQILDRGAGGTLTLVNLRLGAGAGGTFTLVEGDTVTGNIEKNYNRALDIETDLSFAAMNNDRGSITLGPYDITLSGNWYNSLSTMGSAIYRSGQGTLYIGGNLDPMYRIYTFNMLPGDIVNGNISMRYSANELAKIEFMQWDGATSGLTVNGSTIDFSTDNDNRLNLAWDAAQTNGVLDWVFRWKGNKVTQLQNWCNGVPAPARIYITAAPTGLTFDPNAHIFYQASDDYTYIGYSNAAVVVTQQPEVRHLDADAIHVEVARFNGDLVSVGAGDTRYRLYWGTEDAGTNGNPLVQWQHANSFGEFPAATGLKSTNITGLARNTTYYYRWWASNDYGAVWSTNEASASFTTLAADTYTAVASGDWSTKTSWTPWGTPEAPDAVMISSGYDMVADAASPGAVASVTLSGAGTSLALARNLTLSGAVSHGAGTAIDLGGHVLNAGGNWEFSGTLARTGGGSLQVGGRFNYYVAGTAFTFAADDRVNQLWSVWGAGNLYTTSTNNLAGSILAFPHPNRSNNTLYMGADAILSGSIDQDVWTLQMQGYSLYLAGNYETDVSGAAALVRVPQTGIMDIGGRLLLAYGKAHPALPGDIIRGNLEFSGAGGTVTLTQPSGAKTGLTVEGNIVFGGTVGSITLDFDAGSPAGADWGLRWKGNHAATLQGWYGTKLMVNNFAGFNPSVHIVYQADTDYTYVGQPRAIGTVILLR